MTNPITKFFSSIFSPRFRRPLAVGYPIQEELIRKDQLIKVQQERISALEGQFSRHLAKQRQEKEIKRDDYDREIIERLRKKEEGIDRKKFKNAVSWRKFFNQLGSTEKPTKLGRKFEITDRDGKVVFGNFLDIISVGNDLAVRTTDGKVVAMGRSINRLIYKPSAMMNYIKKASLPLAIDEKFRPVLDIEEEETNEVFYDEETGEYKEAIELMKPLGEMIKERDEEIREKRDYAERLEKINIDLRNQYEDEKRTKRLLDNRAERLQSEFSTAQDKFIQLENKFSEMHGKIVQLTQLKSIHETMIEKVKAINRKLLDKMEEFGTSTEYHKIKAEIQDFLEWARDITPETIYQKEEKEEKTPPATMPGQRMGST